MLHLQVFQAKTNDKFCKASRLVGLCIHIWLYVGHKRDRPNRHILDFVKLDLNFSLQISCQVTNSTRQVNLTINLTPPKSYDCHTL